MDDPQSQSTAHDDATAGPATHRIGCVSYLNARPLIEGLDGQPNAAVRFDVPARLLADLEAGEVDIALCPVIDYHRAREPLVIVPVGGIGCDGSTLTVRLFSRVPIERINAIHADTESHTSVALLRVLLAKRYNLWPKLIDYHAREHVAEHRLSEPPEAMLLIGDKVVTDSPLAVTYPHQLDLGEAWHTWTGLPFLFAVWMARRATDLGTLPQQLDEQRRINSQRIGAIVDRHAAAHGWPRDLALQYLSNILRFAVGARELEAMQRFSELAAALELIPEARPVQTVQSNTKPQ